MNVLEKALLSKSQQLTTFSVFTGSYWPLVSLPDFNVQGRNFLLGTEAEMLGWGPLVTDDRTLRAWESYSNYMLQNSGWFPPSEIEERLKKQLEHPEEQAKEQDSRDKNGGELPGKESGLYVPLWQISPWLYNAWINYNLTSQFEESILLLLQSKRPVWSPFLNFTDQPTLSNPNNISVEIEDEEDTADASASSENAIVASFLFHPVFRSLRNHDVLYESVTNTTEDSDEVVAIYMTAIQWDKFLAGLVPKGTPAVDLLLQNPWGQSLTYKVDKGEDGASTISLLVGPGDQHDPEYNDMAQAANLTSRPDGIPPIATIAAETATTSNAASGAAIQDRHPHTEEELLEAGYDPAERLDNYTSTSGNSAGVGYLSMTIYPTSQFEDSFKSNEPLRYTSTMAVVVFLAIVAFFLYSRFVYNRQRKLVETANRTALVVKSLFPSNVRDRIMKEAEETDLKSKAKRLKKQQQQQIPDGSNSERGSFRSGGNSILAASTAPRPAGVRRSRRPSIDFRISLPGRRPSNEERSEGPPAWARNSLGVSSSQNNFSENPYGSAPIADHFKETVRAKESNLPFE